MQSFSYLVFYTFLIFCEILGAMLDEVDRVVQQLVQVVKWCYILFIYYIKTEIGLFIAITSLHIIFTISLMLALLNLIDSFSCYFHVIILIIKLYEMLIIVLSSYVGFFACFAMYSIGVKSKWVLIMLFIVVFWASQVRLPKIGMKWLFHTLWN